MVQQVAHDKSLSRFTARPPGAEVPREVFAAAAAEIAEPFVAEGWRYAKSGPHLTRSRGPVTAKLAFGSSGRNVADQLVAFRATVIISDKSLRDWRSGLLNPLRPDNVAATKHVGHLLQPPRWVEWNLADTRQRASTVRDIGETLRTVVADYVDPLSAALTDPAADLHALAGTVDDTALIEYFVRASRLEEARSIVDATLERFNDRGREAFASRVEEYQREGLPAVQLHPNSPAALAFLVVRFEIPSSNL